MEPASTITPVVIEREALRNLIPSLGRRGYVAIGPSLRDGAIVYDTLSQIEDLPVGWTDEQEPARYRLRQTKTESLFGYCVGPQSWKKFLHPAEIRLFEVDRNDGEFRILPNSESSPHYAFVGVRPCELAAIRIQDRVLVDDRYTDPIYQQRRQEAFIVAVNCTRATSNCFCASMHTGPEAGPGYDIVLTELMDGDGIHPQYLAEAGTDQGAEILNELPHSEACPSICRKAEEAIAQAAVQTRSIDLDGIRELLFGNFYHPHWDQVAARCLSCANCTMVCPTCFCTNVEDTSDVSGEHAGRWRKWDSCFSQAFSHIHGGSVRTSVKSRYRQWITHKLAAWIDQFGTSGCVGCGRCITWCPAGIDITEEVRSIREEKVPAGLQEDENGDA